MEKYKASRNSIEEDEKLDREATDQESTENMIDAGLEVAEHIPVASLYAKGAKTVNKLTGGALTRGTAKVTNEVLKKSPMGNQAQGVINQANNSGLTNKVGNLASKKSGKTGKNISNKYKTSNSKSSGVISSNIIGSLMDKIPTSLKIKIYVGIGIVIMSLMLFVTVFAEQDVINLSLTQGSAGGSAGYNNVAGGDLIAKLEELGRWYIDNVNTYTCNTGGCGASPFKNCRKNYENPYTHRAYGDDCTEFVAAYMDYVCGSSIPVSYSGGMVDPNGSWAQSVAQCGWKAYSSDEIDYLQPGDVLIAHAGSLYSTKGHHGEVYIDENHTFGWGSIKCNYPTNNTIVKKEYNGHIHFDDGGHDYITIYRYEGTTTSTDSDE